MNTFLNASPLLGRILISLIFLMAGLEKISGYEGTQVYMQAMGVPGVLLPLVIVLEVVGALFIIAGFKTRITAFLLSGFCLLSALLFHMNFDDQMQAILFMKNVSIAGGFLFLVAYGAGNYSLDNKFSKE